MNAPNAQTGKPGLDFTPSQLVPNALLRTKDVCTVAGKSRPSLYEAMAAGLWPRPIKLGAKSSAWKASEVNRSRVAGLNITFKRGLYSLTH